MYGQKRASGMKHHAAVRVIAFKWIRIIDRMWQTREPNDESRTYSSFRRATHIDVRFVPRYIPAVFHFSLPPDSLSATHTDSDL